MEIMLTNLPKSRKNDYSCTFIRIIPLSERRFNKVKVLHLQYVHDPLHAFKTVKYKYKIQWTFVYVYNRRTKEYIGTVNLSSNDI